MLLADFLLAYWPHAVAAGSIIAAIFTYVKLTQDIDKIRLERKKILLEIEKLEKDRRGSPQPDNALAVATLEQTLSIAHGTSTFAALKEMLVAGSVRKEVATVIGRNNSTSRLYSSDVQWIAQKIDAVLSPVGLFIPSLWILPTAMTLERFTHFRAPWYLWWLLAIPLV